MSEDSSLKSGLRFYPFDVDSVRVVEGPKEVAEYEKLMEENVKKTRFSVLGMRTRMAGPIIETISGSGGRDDECDQGPAF